MSRIAFSIATAVLCTGVWGACSASSGDDSGGNASNSTGSGSSSGADASLGGSSGFGGNTGTGSTPSFAGSVNTVGMPDACAKVTQKPEDIIVYHDATVTDTTYTYSPIAIYIMQDRSSSMIGYLGTGDANSWNNASSAINGFVTDPASQGIEVGLGVFPPISNAEGNCDGSDCGQPLVNIAPLPGNAQPIMNAMQQANPSSSLLPLFTPTECALRGMINECLNYMSTSNGIPCVAILVTDGNPTTCDLVANNLAAIVADGLTQGVKTFALGMPGSNMAFLNQIAQAGGTDCEPNTANYACDVTSGSSAFAAALNGIRDAVANVSTSQVVTQTVVETPLDCQWRIPEPAEGDTFDPMKVNLTFTPQVGDPVQFGYVASPNDCSAADAAWYYDNPADPKEVFVCPATCDVIKASMGAQIDLVLGCETVPAVLR